MIYSYESKIIKLGLVLSEYTILVKSRTRTILLKNLPFSTIPLLLYRKKNTLVVDFVDLIVRKLYVLKEVFHFAQSLFDIIESVCHRWWSLLVVVVRRLLYGSWIHNLDHNNNKKDARNHLARYHLFAYWRSICICTHSTLGPVSSPSPHNNTHFYQWGKPWKFKISVLKYFHLQFDRYLLTLVLFLEIHLGFQTVLAFSFNLWPEKVKVRRPW